MNDTIRGIEITINKAKVTRSTSLVRLPNETAAPIAEEA